MYNVIPALQVLNTRLAQKNQEIEVLARKVDIQQKVIERGEVRVS